MWGNEGYPPKTSIFENSKLLSNTRKSEPRHPCEIETHQIELQVHPIYKQEKITRDARYVLDLNSGFVQKETTTESNR